MSASTFKLGVGVPREVEWDGRVMDREALYSWIWEALAPLGLLGVHEGTLLSEEAAAAGLETDSWTVDSGEAPRERDWVSGQEQVETELYFDSAGNATRARELLRELPGLIVGEIEEIEPADWDAEWKASFKGIEVPPFWSVLPPWERGASGSDRLVLRVNPGAGFGTGTHETTRLCLEALGQASRSLQGERVLDFGSGSGILAIGAALLGARVDAVEIDPLAIENATENAGLNQVSSSIRYSRALGEPSERYAIVFANILKPVLLEFAERLTARLAPGGTLILSGLIETDVPEVVARYSELLSRRGPAARADVRALNEWRAVVWSRV